MKKQLFIAVLFFLFFIHPAAAFSIDSVKITIDGADSKSANIDFHYSLGWWESIYYRYLAGISGGEQKLMESEFSKILGTKVEVTELNTDSNDVKLRVLDFIANKVDFKDSYWISYAGLIPTGDSFTIKNVAVIYPDGYIKTYNGKISSDVHFVNDKLSSYYYRSQYYQTLYENSYGVYDGNNYQLRKILTLVGDMISRTGYYDYIINLGLDWIVEGVDMPEKLQWMQSLNSLKESIDTITTGDPYKNLADMNNKELMKTVATDSTLIGYMSGGDIDGTHKKIADDMKKMSDLKSEEVTLLEKLVSEGPKEWDNNLDLLNSNLNNQKTTLNDLNEASNKMVKDVEDWGSRYSESGEVFPYLESISGLAKQISEEDLNNINEESEYLDKS